MFLNFIFIFIFNFIFIIIFIFIYIYIFILIFILILYLLFFFIQAANPLSILFFLSQRFQIICQFLLYFIEIFPHIYIRIKLINKSVLRNIRKNTSIFNFIQIIHILHIVLRLSIRNFKRVNFLSLTLISKFKKIFN